MTCEPLSSSRLLLLAVAGLVGGVAATSSAVDFTWAPAAPGTDEGVRWNQPANWSPFGLPGAGDRVFIHADKYGPLLNTNVTIQNLTIDDQLIDTVGEGGHTLNVTGTTTLLGDNPQLYADSGDRVSLGTLTNYAGGVLSGVDDDYYLFDDSTGGSIMEFRGADITDLHANVYLYGPAPRFLDQDTGQSALRNWSINRGFFAMGEGADLTTNTSLTNHNYLSIGERYDTRGFTTNLEIGGSLTNTEDGGIDVIADTLLRVAGDLTNDGGIRVGDSSGQTAGSARLVVIGNVTSSGAIRIYDGGSLFVGGTLNIAPGSQLEIDADPAFETFQMTAARIDLAAGTRFGARGTVFADLVDRGVFAPGASPGEVTIRGSLTLTETATTEIELAGSTGGVNFDRVVQVAAEAGDATTLGGALALSVLDGYVPAYGAAHRIFDTAGRSGTFATVTGHQVQPNRWLAVTYDATGVIVTAALPGDADVSGDVAFADLVALAQRYNQPAGQTWSTGDFTGDGATNFADLVALAQRYNQQVSAATLASLGGEGFASDWALAQSLVPEPGMILAMGVTLPLLRRRRGGR